MAATATRLKNRIRHWRRERGLSQEALGLKVGLSKATISKLERGGLHLRDVTIARLVAALDVPAGELLGDFASGAPSREPTEPEPTPDADSRATHFGFRAVDWGEKAGLVREVFDSVASRYDLMNDLMSGGVHRLWKAEMVTWLRPRPGMTVLDVAGGTGDVAYRIHERIHERAGGEEEGGRIIVCDINRAMLAAGRDRALDRGIVHGIDWLCGDAEALPVADASVDAYTIAFGIRNVTRLDRALAEARRVLRPGGRFLCLEFGRVVVPGLASLYDAYSFRVLPALGALVARDRDAYRYLVESIRRFPDQARFSEMIAEAGFGARRHRNLAGGIAVLYSAWRV